MDRARKARRDVRRASTALRAIRGEWSHRPAFARWEAEGAFHLPDLLRLLHDAGVDPVPLAATIRRAEESAEYARAALDTHAWDAVAEDLDRVLGALGRIEESMGLRPRFDAPRLRRRTALRFVRGLFQLFPHSSGQAPIEAWRRLDVALARLKDARRGATRILDPCVLPVRLRPSVLRAVRGAHRSVRADVRRVFDEAQEAADYALAGLELGASGAAQTDLERLDTALRAIRHVVQRESEFYLPEPWPIRGLARVAMAAIVRKEARVDARERTQETMVILEEKSRREKGAEPS